VDIIKSDIEHKDGIGYGLEITYISKKKIGLVFWLLQWFITAAGMNLTKI